MINVNLRQLRAFLSIAREGSFRRAAERLHVSPSALTLTIKELETEIGMRLFDRTTRSVTATPQAAAFLPIAERLLSDFGRALDDLHAVAERKRGLVAVAAPGSIITFVLAPALSALVKDHPAIQCRVIDDTTSSLIKRVLDGEVDFGITTLLHPVEGIDAILLIRDRLGVVFSNRHPFAREKGPLAAADLAPSRLISLATAAGIGNLVDQQPKLAARLTRSNVEVSNAQALHSLVARDVGIGLVPALTARAATYSNIGFRPLAKPVVMREVFFLRARNRTLSPAATALAERVLAEINKLPTDTEIKRETDIKLDDLMGFSHV